ncbi:hypothetical protein EYF80_061135 [Liparis tanakae]|uniref:Uncharacterized protein n=1 Tax=Liparis tanakae TaxID=230148 RepID=A0A4Z2EIE5_9TELE|nr:hypothetical protein EYF80_061135 [Liparis tanakae]
MTMSVSKRFLKGISFLLDPPGTKNKNKQQNQSNHSFPPLHYLLILACALCDITASCFSRVDERRAASL